MDIVIRISHWRNDWWQKNDNSNLLCIATVSWPKVIKVWRLYNLRDELCVPGTKILHQCHLEVIIIVHLRSYVCVCSHKCQEDGMFFLITFVIQCLTLFRMGGGVNFPPPPYRPYEIGLTYKSACLCLFILKTFEALIGDNVMNVSIW